MKFAMPLDLCKIEFHDRVFQKVDYDAEEKKAKEAAKKESKAKFPKKTKTYLAPEICKKHTCTEFDPAKMDRVELAFRKFDLNQDGYLSREEFDQMMKNV